MQPAAANARHRCVTGAAAGAVRELKAILSCLCLDYGISCRILTHHTPSADMVINLVLVDPSLGLDHDSHDGVEMLCFARDANSLPRPRRLGDIIRLHRVEAQSFNMRPQLLGKIFLQGERRQGMGSCAFTLFDGASGGSEHPYQSSHPTYGWDDREPGLLAAMRAFVAERGRAHLTGGGEWLRRIKDVRPALFFDVVSLVVASDTSDPMLRVLWIWDNSDVVPLTLGADTRDEESTGRQEPAELAALRASLAPLPLPLADMEDGLARVPKLGTALPVVLQAGTAMQSWPAPGTWVKFRNLGARAVQGQLQVGMRAACASEAVVASAAKERSVGSWCWLNQAH